MIHEMDPSVLAEWVDGAWARDGRRIDGGEINEPTTVLWLTAGEYFADLREFHSSSEPHDLDKTQAFGGRIGVDGGVVSWHHDLDTMPRPEGHADANPVHGTRDDLVEVGENYEEFWHRVDHGRHVHGVAELRARDENDINQVVARVVLVDDRAIAIWSQPHPGASLFEQHEGWTMTTTIGSESGDDLMPIVVSLATNDTLSPGWSSVPERS